MKLDSGAALIMLRQHMKDTIKIHDFSGWKSQEIRPQIVCVDGVGLSVQASSGHYCEPRIDGPVTYYSVEVGYPDIVPPLSWKPYAEEWSKPLLDKIKSFKWAIKDRFKRWFKEVRISCISGYELWQDKELSAQAALRLTWQRIREHSYRGTAIRIYWRDLWNPMPKNTIYAWIPIELVAEFIAEHGGIDYLKSKNPKWEYMFDDLTGVLKQNLEKGELQ